MMANVTSMSHHHHQSIMQLKGTTLVPITKASSQTDNNNVLQQLKQLKNWINDNSKVFTLSANQKPSMLEKEMANNCVLTSMVQKNGSHKSSAASITKITLKPIGPYTQTTKRDGNLLKKQCISVHNRNISNGTNQTILLTSVSHGQAYNKLALNNVDQIQGGNGNLLIFQSANKKSPTLASLNDLSFSPASFSAAKSSAGEEKFFINDQPVSVIAKSFNHIKNRMHNMKNHQVIKKNRKTNAKEQKKFLEDIKKDSFSENVNRSSSLGYSRLNYLSRHQPQLPEKIFADTDDEDEDEDVLFCYSLNNINSFSKNNIQLKSPQSSSSNLSDLENNPPITSNAQTIEKKTSPKKLTNFVLNEVRSSEVCPSIIKLKASNGITKPIEAVQANFSTLKRESVSEQTIVKHVIEESHMAKKIRSMPISARMICQDKGNSLVTVNQNKQLNKRKQSHNGLNTYLPVDITKKIMLLVENQNDMKFLREKCWEKILQEIPIKKMLIDHQRFFRQHSLRMLAAGCKQCFLQQAKKKI